MKASSAARSPLLPWITVLLCLVSTPRSEAAPNAKLGGKRAAAIPQAADESELTPRIDSLKWQGNDALSKRELQAVAFTQAPSWRIWELWKEKPEFSETTLIGDLERIEALYGLHGYYEATTSYTLTWNRERPLVNIRVLIDEGPTVETVEREIAIPEALSLDLGERGLKALLADLPLAVGDAFSPDRYARSKQLLLERLADVGYPRARVEGSATVDVSAHQARVDWHLVAGPLVRLGAVEIEGLYLVDEATARREIRVVEGDHYSNRALLRMRRGLQQQGLYQWVNVTTRPPRPRPETDEESSAEAPGAEMAPEAEASAPPEADREPLEEQTWPVQVRVTERAPYGLDVGVGYGRDESFRASIGWRHNNFFGDARKLRITVLYSGILQSLEAEFNQPYFIDPKVSLVSKASLRREDEPAYLARRALASLGVSRPITGSWVARINYEISYNDVSLKDGALDVILDEPTGVTQVSSFELGVRRQTLDDILNPRKGTWLDLAVIPAARAIGSDFDYVTLLAEGRVFLPLWQTVLALRLRIGAIQPFGDTAPDQVPVVSRFFTGGSNSMRGFRYHRMPPIDSVSDNVGGTSLLEASTELRFPIWRKLGGVLFIDAGQLHLEPFRYELDRLFWAAGAGLRYDTVVGPLRADFGYLLDPLDTGADRFQWFVSVGHSF